MKSRLVRNTCHKLYKFSIEVGPSLTELARLLALSAVIHVPGELRRASDFGIPALVRCPFRVRDLEEERAKARACPRPPGPPPHCTRPSTFQPRARSQPSSDRPQHEIDHPTTSRRRPHRLQSRCAPQ